MQSAFGVTPQALIAFAAKFSFCSTTCWHPAWRSRRERKKRYRCEISLMNVHTEGARNLIRIPDTNIDVCVMLTNFLGFFLLLFFVGNVFSLFCSHSLCDSLLVQRHHHENRNDLSTIFLVRDWLKMNHEQKIKDSSCRQMSLLFLIQKRMIKRKTENKIGLWLVLCIVSIYRIHSWTSWANERIYI